MSDNSLWIQGNGHLASYACHPIYSRGRYHFQPNSVCRSVFQCDRDRIIHSTAFRRLAHKTQVFVYHEGDHYHTRMTHTLEVAQIARSIARMLSINEDLTEALALAHDLGHPPFGHAGEAVLNELMTDYGGFDHNAQNLRVVTQLEHRYAEFNGLNLTWECLEGLVKHNGPLILRNGMPIGTYAKTGLPHVITVHATSQDLELWSFPSLEAQVASMADDIAYNAHDLDDGIRAGFLKLDTMQDVPLFGACLAEVDNAYPGLDCVRRRHESLRRMITRMVHDLVNEVRRRIYEDDPKCASDVRYGARPIVEFSAELSCEEKQLKDYLMRNVYQHEHVVGVMKVASQVVRKLFTEYKNNFEVLPDQERILIANCDEPGSVCLICDFIAGMTDRFALLEYERLFGQRPQLR